MTTLIAKHTVKANGEFVAPGRPFEVDDDETVGQLIARGAADRKTRTVDDSEDDEPLPLADVIAMADQNGVTTAKFRKAAVHHLGADKTPTKKADILEALKALPAAGQQ